MRPGDRGQTPPPMAHHRCRYFMKRLWLLFSQAVTVFVAAYFVVATSQPEGLGRGGPRSAAGVALLQAPATPGAQPANGSFSAAAHRAAPAVVSINTSKEVRSLRSNDPWFQLFFCHPRGHCT